jgi:hypothetical protein
MNNDYALYIFCHVLFKKFKGSQKIKNSKKIVPPIVPNKKSNFL